MNAARTNIRMGEKQKENEKHEFARVRGAVRVVNIPVARMCVWVRCWDKYSHCALRCIAYWEKMLSTLRAALLSPKNVEPACEYKLEHVICMYITHATYSMRGKSWDESCFWNGQMVSNFCTVLFP